MSDAVEAIEQTEAPAKRRRVPSDDTHVMRISKENFELLRVLKAAYAAKHGKQRMTYNEMLGQTLAVVQALLAGAEFYEVDGRVFSDAAEARGHAIVNAVRQKLPVRMPRVLVYVSEDTGP